MLVHQGTGQRLLTSEEEQQRAEEERQRAEEERRRADEAERHAENERRRADEAEQRVTVKLLKNLANQRFGELPGWVEERIDQADADALDRWTSRLLAADRLEDVFDG